MARTSFFRSFNDSNLNDGINAIINANIAKGCFLDEDFREALILEVRLGAQQSLHESFPSQYSESVVKFEKPIKVNVIPQFIKLNVAKYFNTTYKSIKWYYNDVDERWTRPAAQSSLSDINVSNKASQVIDEDDEPKKELSDITIDNIIEVMSTFSNPKQFCSLRKMFAECKMESLYEEAFAQYRNNR